MSFRIRSSNNSINHRRHIVSNTQEIQQIKELQKNTKFITLDSSDVTRSSSELTRVEKGIVIGKGSTEYTLPLASGVSGQFITAGLNGSTTWTTVEGSGLGISVSELQTLVSNLTNRLNALTGTI